jgi:hypothetical protein
MDKDTTENKPGCGNDQLDRRSFVKFIPALGAAGLVAVNLPVSSPAQTPSASSSPTPSPTPAAPSPLAEAYAEVARVRFGKHLDDSQWDRVKRDLEGNVRTADRLREAKLKNSDEPDFTFIA